MGDGVQCAGMGNLESLGVCEVEGHGPGRDGEAWKLDSRSETLGIVGVKDGSPVWV